MKPIKLKFKKQTLPKLTKKLSNETCSVCPKLVEGFATDEGAETPRACRTSANKVGSRPKLDPKILFKTDVSLMWFVTFVPTHMNKKHFFMQQKSSVQILSKYALFVGFRDDFAFCQNFSTWKKVSQPTGMVQSL